MAQIIAPVPASHQKDGITILAIEFDSDTDGWYLYGLSEPGGAPILELWNMSEDDAKTLAASDWGVSDDAWAEESASSAVKTVDSNGTELQDGDSVTVIKDLPLKGSSTVIKRGTVIKRIALTNDPEHVDCYGGPVKGLVLKSCFVKKV